MGIFSGQKYLIFSVFLWLAWLNCAHLGMLKSSCPPAQGRCQWRLWTVTLMTSQVVQGTTLLLAVLDPVRQQSRRMMGVVRGLNASMTSLSHICWSKKQFLSDSRQKATQIFYQHETEKIAEKYILSGQPSGCFSLCPDLRKSTTSIPPNPEYGIKPELKVRKETLLDEWFPHFTLGWLWILGSRDC